jgi:GT2 family glycosyltransferase
VSARPDRVGVVVVDWSSAELVGRSLSALHRQTVPPAAIVIVDNASPTPTERHLHTDHPSVKLVRLPENIGFAGGGNHGVGLTPELEWIAFLNPDAFPEPDWLERLLAAAQENPEYSFFASRQLQDSDPSIIDGAGDVYAVSGLAWRRGHGQRAPGRHTDREEVFGACAAAALYRRAAFLEVGGFDESFFCYFEDVDLAFRLRLAGHRCLYVPDAVVRHVGSATTGRRSDFSVYHGHRNLVWTWLKNMPLPLMMAYLPHHVALTLVSLIHLGARGQGGALLRARRDALRSVPRVLRQRREIQRRRRVGAFELRRQMVGGLAALGVRRGPPERA